VSVVLLISGGLIILGIILEITLRLLFGFGNPLTYIADPQIGYLLSPNQQTRRFGNQIAINQYSMRSPDLALERSPDTLRILLVGDSVANGGWWTDQKEIVSVIMQQLLKPPMPKSFQQIEVLNASANSWSPRNELAYLRQFGTFAAQIVVLLINTDDLFGTAPTTLPVGRDRNYPDRKPALALIEVITRYLIKPDPIPELKAVQAEAGDRVGFNLEAIAQIQATVAQASGQLLLAMTPLLREIGTPGSRDYEQTARQRLQDFTQSQQIRYLDFLPIFKATAQPQTLFRDHIHLSSLGNQQISQNLSEAIQQMLGWEQKMLDREQK
jgi:lysophospholipase L1-like esterase